MDLEGEGSFWPVSVQVGTNTPVRELGAPSSLQPACLGLLPAVSWTLVAWFLNQGQKHSQAPHVVVTDQDVVSAPSSKTQAACLNTQVGSDTRCTWCLSMQPGSPPWGQCGCPLEKTRVSVALG